MRRSIIGLIAALVLAGVAGDAGAVPASFTFTGRLADGGAPIDGSVTIDLALYDVASGGSSLWSESHATTAASGLVSVAMGGQSALDPGDFAGGDLWLAVTVNGTALSPRFQIRSVPYAIRAEVCDSADAVGGIPAAEVQQVLDSSCAVGSAIRDISPAGAVTCEPVVAGGGVPSGAIMFFDTACPTGWSAYAALTGRVPVGATASIGAAVGTQLTSLGTRTIVEVPAHTHAADPASATTSNGGGHTHDVDPAVFTTASGGSHTHTEVNPGQGGGTSWRLAWSGTIDNGAGDVTIPSSGSSHTHSINVPLTTSTTAGAHDHTLDIAAFTTGSTGSAAVDVTMPYLQLRVCRKD